MVGERRGGGGVARGGAEDNSNPRNAKADLSQT